VVNRVQFTATSELKQSGLFVQILEDKLHDFYQILPLPDPRRGLLNLGGNTLKTIFGTATVVTGRGWSHLGFRLEEGILSGCHHAPLRPRLRQS